MTWPQGRTASLLRLVAALAAPAVLTAILLAANLGNTRDYAFLYLGVVAILGLATGLRDALVAAVASFLLVDYFLVRPVHTLQFADATDLVNLAVFVCAAGLVGTLGSRRRLAQLRAEQLAHELQRANLELARLAEAEQQVRVLEESDRVRRELLANVSHELRTPMASILTDSTALLNRGALPPEVTARVESLVAEARRLNRLVSDLLEVTRIEGGIIDLRPTEIDVADAVNAAVHRLHRQHPDRDVDVELAPSVGEVVADWQRLGQVFDNLLENADRWAPRGTAIRISASTAAGAMVQIRVMDEGPGVSPQIRERIFERFVRGGSPPADGTTGLGLGLAIVRGLVEAQGGTVRLESSPPVEPTSFVVTLPAADAAAGASRE